MRIFWTYKDGNKKIFENNEEWVASKLEKDSEYLKNLDKEQNPETLYVECSDSRVASEDLMGAEPGGFVHRNVTCILESIK